MIPDEDLNIPRRELLYILTALNRVRTVSQAAVLLGICERTLDKKKQKLGIYKNKATGRYEQVVKIKT